MIVHALYSEELHKEALNSQNWLEGLWESLSRLHADDAAVMQLVEIWFDLINMQRPEGT